MSIATATRTHPILGCVDEVRAALAAVGEVQPVFMDTGQKQAALVELAQAEAQLTELRLRVLAAADGIGQESGARDAAAWLSHATRTDPALSRAEARLAKALEIRTTVAAGLRTGQVTAAQARVITNILSELPTDLDPQLAQDAETTLVGYCDQFRPIELRRLARRLLDIIAPEIAEEHDAKRLEEEERRAHTKAFLTFLDRGDGSTHLRGLLTTPVTERLKRYLHAYTSPRAATPGEPGETAGNGERVPQHRAHAHAFSALLELLDPDKLPEHGGDATTLIITMTIDQLRTDLATADILTDNDNGELTITAGQARRLACQAALIPAVLGTDSQILDLGRTSRLHRPHQRKAIRLRDQQCRAEGCTIPATWCEIHHKVPWSQGGPTSVEDGVCFCSHHHHLIHDRAYDHTWLPHGDVRFHRRT